MVEEVEKGVSCTFLDCQCVCLQNRLFMNGCLFCLIYEWFSTEFLLFGRTDMGAVIRVAWAAKHSGYLGKLRRVGLLHHGLPGEFFPQQLEAWGLQP